MEPGIHDQHNAHPGRLTQQSLFGESVWLKLSVLEGSDRILGRLIPPVKGRKIEVRRSVADVRIFAVSTEYVLLISYIQRLS